MEAERFTPKKEQKSMFEPKDEKKDDQEEPVMGRLRAPVVSNLKSMKVSLLFSLGGVNVAGPPQKERNNKIYDIICLSPSRYRLKL